MQDLLKLFEDSKGYTVKEIAELLEKSENYVARKLKDAGVSPQGEKITAMGPNSKVWKGSVVKMLIKKNEFGNMNVGEIIWYDDKPTKVYLVTFNLNVDGKSIPSYKIGITSKDNIIKGRFKEEVSTGLMTDLEVQTELQFSCRADAEAYETSLFNLIVDTFGGYRLNDGSVRFHNFYTKAQPKGITEMRSRNEEEIDFLFSEITSYGSLDSI